MSSGKENKMRRPKHYPESLLEALNLNEVCNLEPGLDYSRLTADQKKGLEFLLDVILTEREAMLLRNRYVDCMGMKKIAEKYGIREKRAYGIIMRALLKLKDRRLLLYVAEGYEARLKNVREHLMWEEQCYCRRIEAFYSSDLYFQGIESLNLPVRVTHALQRHGVHQIRELVILSQYSDGIRRIHLLGETAEEQIENALQKGGLLPKHYEKILGKPPYMNPDRELTAFHNLNLWYFRESNRAEIEPDDNGNVGNGADEANEEAEDGREEADEDDGNSISQ